MTSKCENPESTPLQQEAQQKPAAPIQRKRFAGDGFALPTPELVKRTFSEITQTDSEAAVRYLYNLGLNSGYIRMEDIERNICWTTASPYGQLEITINLSKPEKDPRAIAAAAENSPEANTASDNRAGFCNENDHSVPPQCALCWENEGWPGSDAFPAKPLLRIAPITLNGEEWGLQYSPYSYYTEHCIALSREHRPMNIDAGCFARLLDFVDQFPFYFIGSNAGLPIVGGSILSHDHFQGGRHDFPLMKAPIRQAFRMPAYPNVHCGIVNWAASTIRLESEDRDQLLAAASATLDAWRTFTCEECAILPRSEDGTQHSTVSPIARKLNTKHGDVYVFDLILRNNRTTKERPWGLFHPREELHHIKKENIGLIEAMGLAILPPRLARELPAVQNLLHAAALNELSHESLLAQLNSNELTKPHTIWAIDILNRRKESLRKEATHSCDNLSPVIKEEVGAVFARILEDVAMFKANESGNLGWSLFLRELSAAF